MSELKPCPFCGGEAELIQSEPSTARFNEGTVNFAVACYGYKCGVMPYPKLWQITKEEAVKAWNTRATVCDITNQT
ncbi:Lar family restriction alleviation protein [Vibrio fluvialis]|nr:Lar family restriction alleviation protein [Vibrio fluvialis]